MKRVDRLVALGVEGDVHPAHWPPLVNPEVVAAVHAEARRAVVGIDERDPLEAERSQSAPIEVEALLEVAHAAANAVGDPRSFAHAIMEADLDGPGVAALRRPRG